MMPPEATIERVLERLGFASRPEPTLAGLQALYGAWCRRVPFDNLRKMIHVRQGDAGPLPGATPEDFFAAWLAYGTGGTCWSGAGALHALLVALGFDATRGIATMLVAPGLPPNHGSVRVALGDAQYLTDCSILHGTPLRLDEDGATSVDHPAWGVRCRLRDGRWHVAWRPLHRVEGFECRLDRFGATRGDFHDLHEATRAWSPFNYEVALRVNRGDRVVGIGFGHAVTLRADGGIDRVAIDRRARDRFLVEEVGIAEELVRRLPDDTPTPPPPGSLTARLGAASRRAAEDC